MFIRVARQKRGNKIYRHLQIAESYRDPKKGNAPRTRILVHLGTVEGLGEEQIEKLVSGLLRAMGRDVAPPELLLARDYGHVHAVDGVWDLLGLPTVLERSSVARKLSIPVADLIRLLVVNRICDPCCKYSLYDWQKSVQYDDNLLPMCHNLLQAMDRLISDKKEAEPLIAESLLSESDQLDLVFYNIISTSFDG